MYIASFKSNQTGLSNNSNLKLSNEPIPLTLYGTLQQGGHLFLEIDGAQIGPNLIYHNNPKNHFGIQNE
jgi:hypothetical protein